MRLVYVAVAGLAASLFWLVAFALRRTEDPLAPPIVQAIVAGGIVGLGWIVTFATQEYRRWREREEMRTDIQMALRAEISDFAAAVDYAGLEEYGKEIEAEIRAGGDGAGAFRVFVPHPKDRVIFDALSESIRHLGAGAVDHVVWFYSQLVDVEAFAEDLRSREFQKLPASRRAEAWRHYIQMLIEAKSRADQAKAALTVALKDDGDEDLDWARRLRREERRAELRDWINSRAAGPDAR